MFFPNPGIVPKALLTPRMLEERCMGLNTFMQEIVAKYDSTDFMEVSEITCVVCSSTLTHLCSATPTPHRTMPHHAMRVLTQSVLDHFLEMGEHADEG